MPVSTLVATAGLATSNSYATVADASSYHDDRPAVGTTWSDALDVPTKTAALLWATKLLDRLVEWSGSPTTPGTQALEWPRAGMIDRLGNSIANDVIPTDLQEACAEFARQLLDDNRTEGSDAELHGITSLETGSLKLKFKDFVPPKIIPSVVVHLLPATWFTEIRGSGVGQVELLRA